MDNLNKLDDFNCSEIQKEYLKLLTPEIDRYLDNLNTIISNVEINGFKMPLLLQNQIYSILLEAKQILTTLSINKHYIKHNQSFENNPIILLLNLNILSQQLNKHTLKSPFYLLTHKANNLILNCIGMILKYFLKNNK